ncbi:MAG: hypothetical protein Ct9H300mP25_00230 [Acidobacteriota bacterium]|nr:MAG: hypothetical protein Ct9H300mP25_00230 [Acidobacteriota bacterium]
MTTQGPEVVAVVAHEVGHYKKQHIVKSMVLSVAHLGVMFWVLSLFLQQEALFEAFFFDRTFSVHRTVVLRVVVYTGRTRALGLTKCVFSKK